MGTIECFVCPNKWEQEGPNGNDFCSVNCFKTIYKNKDEMPEVYEAKIKAIIERNKKYGLKF